MSSDEIIASIAVGQISLGDFFSANAEWSEIWVENEAIYPSVKWSSCRTKSIRQLVWWPLSYSYTNTWYRSS